MVRSPLPDLVADAPVASTTASDIAALETTLRAAALLIESGASGNGAHSAVTHIARNIAPADTTFTFAGPLVAAHATGASGPVSLVRPVSLNSANLERASSVESLAEGVAAGRVDAAALPAELDRIAEIPDPYGPWVTMLAAMAAGVSWAMLLDGGPRAAIVAVAATLIGHGVQLWLGAMHMPRSFVIFVSAVTASLVAAAGVRLGFAPLGDTVGIPAIAWLIPGLGFINGLIDLLSIRHSALGIQRTIGALVLFMLIGVAIAIGVVAAGG
jgi:uncharacterized membrane protein YjjP (DUF1212 family)